MKLENEPLDNLKCLQKTYVRYFIIDIKKKQKKKIGSQKNIQDL